MAKQIKKDVHIYVELNMVKEIQELSIKEKTSLSDMYSKLLRYGLEYDDLSRKVEELRSILNKIDSTNYYNKKLLQQIYSDLNLEKTDVRNSYNLNEFNRENFKGRKSLID